MADRALSIEVLRERERIITEALISFEAKWAVALAVGNGGALAALAAKVLSDVGGEAVPLIFPSAWLFASGLICAGAMPMDGIRGLRRERSLVVEHIAKTESGQATIFDGNARPMKWLDHGLGISAAVMFVAGLLYPLSVLTLRYFRTGGFG